MNRLEISEHMRRKKGGSRKTVHVKAHERQPKTPARALSEDQIEKMFLSMFLWVAQYRPAWLEKVIRLKKAALKGDPKARELINKLLDANYTGVLP